jgi:hypothetical protein
MSHFDEGLSLLYFCVWEMFEDVAEEAVCRFSSNPSKNSGFVRLNWIKAVVEAFAWEVEVAEMDVGSLFYYEALVEVYEHLLQFCASQKH